jgi:hypothetical protein
MFLGRSFQKQNFECYQQKILAGKRKKIAKFLMRTFTCCSTFLYGQGHLTYEKRTSAFRHEGSGMIKVLLAIQKAKNAIAVPFSSNV